MSQELIEILVARLRQERDEARALLHQIATDGTRPKGEQRRAARKFLNGRTPQIIAAMEHKLADAETRAARLEEAGAGMREGWQRVLDDAPGQPCIIPMRWLEAWDSALTPAESSSAHTQPRRDLGSEHEDALNSGGTKEAP